MTQDEGTTEQFQGNDEGTGAPPRNPVECDYFSLHRSPRRRAGLTSHICNENWLFVTFGDKGGCRSQASNDDAEHVRCPSAPVINSQPAGNRDGPGTLAPLRG